jgi:hypothetical protein
MRQPDNQPNLVWVNAIRNVQLTDADERQQRNNFLYTILAALQDTTLLRQLRVQRDIVPFIRHYLAQQPGYVQLPVRLALSDLAAALSYAGRMTEAWAIVAVLPGPLAKATAIRVGEQAMLVNNRSQSAKLDSFLVAYLNHEAQQPLKVANSILPLLYWQFEKTSCWEEGVQGATTFPIRERRGIHGIATFLVREGRPATQQTGPSYMCKGRSLADNSFGAMLDVPDYQSERLRQGYYNTILVGLAHLRVAKPGDGWREYDEKMLLKPADYEGPID